MLTSIKGTYRNGQIELQEAPAEIQSDTPVIVTFMTSSDVNLKARGITQEQAAELHLALSPFQDWNETEMDIYDDYESAKASL